MQFFKKIFVLAAVLMFAVSSYAAAAAGLTGIRTSSGAERDRIVFDLTQMPVYHVTLSEDGREVTFDFADTNAAALKRAAVRTRRVESVSYTKRGSHFYVTVTMAKGMAYEIGNLTNPFRIFLDIAPKGAVKTPAGPVPPVPAKSEKPAGGGTAATKPENPQLPILRETKLAEGLTQRTYVY